MSLSARKRKFFHIIPFEQQGNFPHGSFMEMCCSSLQPWPGHYRKCIFMEDLLQLPSAGCGGDGNVENGVCSVNGQQCAMMWIPSVKLNWLHFPPWPACHYWCIVLWHKELLCDVARQVLERRENKREWTMKEIYAYVCIYTYTYKFLLRIVSYNQKNPPDLHDSKWLSLW